MKPSQQPAGFTPLASNPAVIAAGGASNAKKTRRTIQGIKRPAASQKDPLCNTKTIPKQYPQSVECLVYKPKLVLAKIANTASKTVTKTAVKTSTVASASTDK